MKRHICAGAGVLLLALAGAGTATAGGLPLLGEPQLGLQSVSLGDQSVGEQSNVAEVTQAQGNGNVNVSPVIAIGGDASSWNAQGNGNQASAVVGQSNAASQSQSVEQGQELSGSQAGCCGGGGQEAVQSVEGGDQSVGEQSNSADVGQYQGNGNLNISPAIAIGGDASSWNAQGNDNDAGAWAAQENAASQTQELSQAQQLDSHGGACCGGSSQSAQQHADLGDQSVGEQSNVAEVTQAQGNGNVNVSPVIAIGGDASSWNAQGNGNQASAVVGQSNAASQSQSVEQGQELSGSRAGCCGGGGQEAVQSVEGGGQSVGEQSNSADVGQYQGNGNLNISPAIAIGGKHGDSCRSTCSGKDGDGYAGASTWNAQGNGNHAGAWVMQGNTATQSQVVDQEQSLATSSDCCQHEDCAKGSASKRCAPHPKSDCCGGPSQAGEQHAIGGDQSVGKQANDATVTQKQGNGNVNRSAAFARGGEKQAPCAKQKDKCGGTKGHAPGASTSNLQGNGNSAQAWVTQGNDATQSQSTTQSQRLLDACENACRDLCKDTCKEVMRW